VERDRSERRDFVGGDVHCPGTTHVVAVPPCPVRRRLAATNGHRSQHPVRGGHPQSQRSSGLQRHDSGRLYAQYRRLRPALARLLDSVGRLHRGAAEGHLPRAIHLRVGDHLLVLLLTATRSHHRRRQRHHQENSVKTLRTQKRYA